MLAIHLLSLLTMLVATSKWLKLTGQQVNMKKSVAFSATNMVRRKPEPLEATLDGVHMQVQHEFRQPRVAVRTMPRWGTSRELQRRSGKAKKALKNTRTIPGGFDRKATVPAVMKVAAAVFWAELADIYQMKCEQLGVCHHGSRLGTEQAPQGERNCNRTTIAGAQSRTLGTCMKGSFVHHKSFYEI